VGANIVQTSTTDAGGNFTTRLLTSPDGDIAEERVVAAIGSYRATAPLTGAGGWVMQMAAFRAAATQQSPPPPTAPQYVQGNYATPQTSQTTVTIPYTGTQSAGDLNVVIAGWNDTLAVINLGDRYEGKGLSEGGGINTIRRSCIPVHLLRQKHLRRYEPGDGDVLTTGGVPKHSGFGV
jgi:hypothetical protein